MSQTLLEQIAAATAGEYHVVGALGETVRGSAFLARETAGGHLVVLFVPADADELAVLAALGDEVPANAGRCTACGYAPPVWAAACPSCHRPFVLTAVDAHRFAADEVHAAVAHAYDVEGEVAHQAGGSLFFVRDRADGRLVALAGQDDENGQVLEAVWDAAAPAPPPEPAPFLAPSAVDDGAEASTGAYPYGPSEGDYGAPRPRRRWGPLVAGGVLVLVAGGAWALWRDDDGDAARPEATSAAAVSPPGDPAGTAGPAGAGAAAVPAPEPPAVTPPPAPAPPREPPAAEERRAAARASVAWLQVGGALPTGWAWVINGRPGPSSVTAPLRPNRPVTVRLDAPGYCPVTLQLPPQAPSAVYRWYPQLQGKPMVGDC